MYVVVCRSNLSTNTFFFDDKGEALDQIKYLAEKGATEITLAKKVEIEIERKVRVKLL